MEKDKDERPRVVIVGAGFGGLSAAQKLKSYPLHITLIDSRNHHLFQPLLYQVATAFLAPEDIAVPLRSLFKDVPHLRVVMDKVVGIDSLKQEVKTLSGDFSYDYLILAPGASQTYFNHPEWASYALGLKNLEDANKLREKILLNLEQAEKAKTAEDRRFLSTYIVIGGGATGVEMAGAISDLTQRILAKEFRQAQLQAAQVFVVESAPRLLSGFPEELSNSARNFLEKKGVQVLLNVNLEEVNSQGVMLQGKIIPAANVIWGAGVQAVPIKKWLDVETDNKGRVKVDNTLATASYPNVFVIGDAACALDEKGNPYPGLAAVAKQQGKYVGKEILRRVKGRQSSKKFRYKNFGSLAVVGKYNAVADFGFLKLKGFLAWMVWGCVHIYFLVSFRNRLRVMTNWIWSYLLGSAGAALITHAIDSEKVSINEEKNKN